MIVFLIFLDLRKLAKTNMVNFIGLCRLVLDSHPLPCDLIYVKSIVENYLKEQSLTREEQKDLVKVIIKNWNRNLDALNEKDLANLNKNYSP